MAKLTETQNKILLAAMSDKVESSHTKIMEDYPSVSGVAILASQAAVLSKQVSLARQAGADFEQLLCLVYGISEVK